MNSIKAHSSYKSPSVRKSTRNVYMKQIRHFITFLNNHIDNCFSSRVILQKNKTDKDRIDICPGRLDIYLSIRALSNHILIFVTHKAKLN